MFVICLFFVFMIGGCAKRDFSELKDLPQKGYAYSQIASKNYRMLAEKELSYWDKESAQYFAAQSIQAAAGVEVQPEAPCSPHRMIEDAEDQSALSAARERLMFALNKSGRIIDPENAAHAVSFYDCWLEEAVEGSSKKTGHKWQDEELHKCRRLFMRSLLAMEGNVRAQAPTFMLWFAPGKDTIGRYGREEVKQVAQVLAHLRNHKVLVHCFGEPGGDRLENLQLSQRRAHNVKQALAEQNVDPVRIEDAVGAGSKDNAEDDPFLRRCDIHLR